MHTALGMNLLILCALLLGQDGDAEKAYRALETKLTGSKRIHVKYKRTSPVEDRRATGSGELELQADSPKWVLKYKDTHKGGSSAAETVGFRNLNGAPLFAYSAAAFLAGGMYETIRIRHVDDERNATECPVFTTSDFKRDGEALQFRLRRSSPAFTRKATVRLWLDPKTGWPARRTYQEDRDRELLVVTETYATFEVDGAPVETSSAQDIEFPDKTDVDALGAKSPAYQRILDGVLKSETWAAARKVVAEKLGPFPDAFSFTVRLVEQDGHELASTATVSEEFTEVSSDDPAPKRTVVITGAVITFNLRKLAQMKDPPAFEKLIAHELAHAHQREEKTPEWFFEGLASWVGDDSCFILAYLSKHKKLGALEEAKGEDAYGRGHLFFKWLEQKSGLAAFPALHQAVHVEAVDWRVALEKITSMKWADIVTAEHAWASNRKR